MEDVARKNNLKSIHKITLKVGKLRQVVPEFLKFAFESLSEGTLAERADLVIEEISITMKCQSCNKIFTVDRSMYVCPYCDEVKLTILTGKEMSLETIEGKTKDAD